ncbi:uncharacterized protein ACLA_079640 [Aspergillus clavatus NRRL 1]|uniref:Uncharacterized protein n=1 Tax=Aspergillus clavatus (strain ATCC 1007 / CBS 513.65 / DSM 816 / NCTC 3887 / NRRL 1 / QM 1276 / 107) TaxID=344612 RepID=A1CSJ3_ASPCL|nr:uncharacterized protein ACLA_079640 [Aspergillus clavatus NRRL 1]EAW06280.1 conserved hypothetical protein [Aspergillus clavatus NRRL 1]
MKTTVNPVDTVTSALKDRKLPFKSEEIESAFIEDSNKDENIQWVEEHLSYDTLLSQEELTLFTTLESSGALRNVLPGPNLGATRPLLDDDLRAAIESLNSSTSTTQEQTRLLNLQNEVLIKQLRLRDDREARQQRDIQRLRQKHDSGRQHIAAASSDLAHDLEVTLKNELEKTATEGKKILSTLTGRLKDDDKLLADLEQTASSVQSTTDDASIVRRATELGSMLAELVAEEIQCRLDRLYMESLKAGLKDMANLSANPNEDEDALITLGNELESLYPEIDVLAEMSTKQLFYEPIVRELQTLHGQLRIASYRKLEHVVEQVSDTILEMTSSTERSIKLLQDRESHCATLEALATSYRAEIGDQFSEKPSSRRDTLSLKRRSTLHTPVFTAPGKRIDPAEMQALGSFLRRIGLSVESVFKPEDGEGDRGSEALFEKRQHLVECLHNMGVGAQFPLVAELTPSDRASLLLTSSLLAHSQFKNSLSAVGQDKELTELESRLGQIQKGIERLNLDVLYQRDRNQEKFMERWR